MRCTWRARMGALHEASPRFVSLRGSSHRFGRWCRSFTCRWWTGWERGHTMSWRGTAVARHAGWRPARSRTVPDPREFGVVDFATGSIRRSSLRPNEIHVEILVTNRRANEPGQLAGPNRVGAVDRQRMVEQQDGGGTPVAGKSPRTVKAG